MTSQTIRRFLLVQSPWKPIHRTIATVLQKQLKGCAAVQTLGQTNRQYSTSENKTAVVTGSTSGLGLAIAKKFAQRGTNVIITGLGEQNAVDSVTAEIKSHGVDANYVACDMSDKSDVVKFTEKVQELYPSGIDILVNNAGIQHVCPVTDFPDEKWEAMIAIMLTAPFLLTKRLSGKMKEKGWGRIINMSSKMGHVSTPGKSVYSTTKSGIIGFTRGAALDLAPYGVTCNAVCPTYALTPLVIQQIVAFGKQRNLEYKEAEREFLRDIPTKCAVTPEQVADLVDFLVYSEASAIITGSSYLIDGGYVAH